MISKQKFIHFFSIFLTVCVFLIPSHKANALVSMPGTECQPANLNQALAFGLGWSQFGVTNNSPLGPTAFFVACPVNVDDVGSGYTTIEVDGDFLEPLAQPINCTIYVVTASNSPPQIINTGNISVNLANPVAQVPIPGGFIHGLDTISLICAMQPQTRINFIQVL